MFAILKKKQQKIFGYDVCEKVAFKKHANFWVKQDEVHDTHIKEFFFFFVLDSDLFVFRKEICRVI